MTDNHGFAAEWRRRIWRRFAGFDGVVLWLVFGTLVGGAVFTLYNIRVADERAWQVCEKAYSRAESGRDSVRVDAMLVPQQARDDPAPLYCGVLRAARTEALPAEAMPEEERLAGTWLIFLDGDRRLSSDGKTMEEQPSLSQGRVTLTKDTTARCPSSAECYSGPFEGSLLGLLGYEFPSPLEMSLKFYPGPDSVFLGMGPCCDLGAIGASGVLSHDDTILGSWRQEVYAGGKWGPLKMSRPQP
ncbi:MAG: hypothetical protein ABFS14_07015 [Gemmatimonadota bacterium]